MPTEKQNDQFQDKQKAGTDTNRSGRQGERDAERQNPSPGAQNPGQGGNVRRDQGGRDKDR